MLGKLYLELWPGFCSIDDVQVVEIETRDGQVFYRFYDLGHKPQNDEELEEYKKSSEEWLDRFDNLNIQRWRKRYDSLVLDGMCWDADYQKIGWKVTRHFYGNNRYPDNWREFIGLMDELRADSGKYPEVLSERWAPE